MPAVALAKEQRGLPTEDPAQEAQVVARARERASLMKVDPERVAALFDAMIRAARHVQDAYRTTPEDDRPPVEGMDLEQEARPALAQLSGTIVDRAADLSRDPVGQVRPTAAVLADALDPSLASADDRFAIASAVVALLASE
jgi:chorismate mutase-like protein